MKYWRELGSNGVAVRWDVEGIHWNSLSTCFVPNFLYIGAPGYSKEDYITFILLLSNEAFYGEFPQLTVLFSVGTTGHQESQGALAACQCCNDPNWCLSNWKPIRGARVHPVPSSPRELSRKRDEDEMQLPHQVLMWQSSNQQPVSGAGASCHLGPQGRHSPRPLALDSRECSLHVTALSSLPTL